MIGNTALLVKIKRKLHAFGFASLLGFLFLVACDDEMPAPDVSTPSTSTPSVSTPDVSTPDISTPDVSTPDVSTPDISTPDDTKIALSRWMKSIDDDKNINEIAIPGTHSSGSKDIKIVILGRNFSTYAQTQNTTITEQLNIGVRFFDIRGSYDSISQKIKIYHGNNDCYITVEEVVNEMKTFLKKYPSETILFSIKVEAGDDFATEFKTGIIDPNPDLFHLEGDTFPSLKTVRGKIVLMRRGGLSGIGNAIKLVISDNTIGLNGNIKVQDLYSPLGFSTDTGISRKIATITSFIPETKADASKHNSAYLYINFTSQAIGDDQPFLFSQYSSGQLRSISQIANIIHAKIIPKLTPNVRGIVAGDFVDKSYTKAVIKNNFLSSSTLYQELETL